ncbi:MAG: hypothetical protein Q4G03_01975 [Planctomycetia bacterium]|nr:hypothetical protein [Planctomycetia bacterium]
MLVKSLSRLLLLTGVFLTLYLTQVFAVEPKIGEDKVDNLYLARVVLPLDNQSSLKLVEPTHVGGYGLGSVPKDGASYCEVSQDDVGRGAGVSYAYTLNQERVQPFVASGWSMAEEIDGSPDASYSLYVDIIYEDGTALWGQTRAFSTQLNKWNRARLLIVPDKPVKSLTCYGLLRNRPGKVYFKDFKLEEYHYPNQVVNFDATPIQVVQPANDCAQLLIRDVVNGEEYYGLDVDWGDASQTAQYNGVALQVESLPEGETAIKLQNQTNEDRVLSVVYTRALPEAPLGDAWLWYDDARRFRVTTGEEYSITRSFAEVGGGKLARYPFAVVAQAQKLSDDLDVKDYLVKKSIALAVNPDFPTFVRLQYNSALKELYASFDIALTPERPCAELRLREIAIESSEETPELFQFGANPFRATLNLYRTLYPEAFKVRVAKQGAWMAFAKISKVENWEDFGFQFKEGIDETQFDDKIGVTSFRYTEPMTWWQQIPKSETSSKTRLGALQTAREIALENKRRENGKPAYMVEEAQSLLTTGYRSADGEFVGRLLDTPWCDGVVWSMNDAPGLAALAREGKLTDESNAELVKAGVPLVTGFETKWNEQIANELYGPIPEKTPNPTTYQEASELQTKPGVDGEYIDSSEGYVTDVLDYRRAHFAGMTTPLVYDSLQKRPAIFRGLIAYEYARKISEDVHARGKLAMANATPSGCFWLVPVLDVLGTETNWNWADAWRPMPDDELLYRRILCVGKPFCFLMNTDFEKFPHELTERYMRRSLAYGFLPSFFSADASTRHYFDNPELYNRDRDLFVKYMPIVKAVAEAGWEPITEASTSSETLYVERFGAMPDATVRSNALAKDATIYLTLFNDSDQDQDFVVTLSPKLTEYLLSTGRTVRELVTAKELSVDISEKNARITGTIPAQETRVFSILPPEK